MPTPNIVTSNEAPLPHAVVEGSGDGVVHALLFAAGESRRMGTPKPLLPWRGQPLVAYQVTQLLAAGAAVVVVTGYAAEQIAPAVRAAGGRAVENAAYRSGRASSVRAGALSLPDDTLAVITLNVDQPRPAAVVRRVLEAHRRGTALITSPEQGGRRGHPTIFAGVLLPELRTVTEETEGLRAVLRRHADRRQFVPIDDPVIHLEFNTPDEYRLALAATEEETV